MADDLRRFSGVHLCGSLPFDQSQEVFRWISREFGSQVRRVPDETGVRAGFIFTQKRYFTDNPAFEPAAPVPGQLVPLTCVRLRRDVAASDVHFERFDYADAAKASFAAFHQAKQEGVLSCETKFLFPIPSALTPVAVFVARASQTRAFPAYQAQTRASVAEILEALPHSELAIQWDVPFEVLGWEGMVSSPLASKEKLLESMVALGDWIPADVELGYHLCYGNSETITHPSAPNAAGLAEIWRGLAAKVRRKIDFVHMAIPIEWQSPEHYRPLAGLDFGPATDLYLGLVHHQDGLAGARRRADAAAGVLGHRFGISTECGLGRYRSEERFRTAVQTLEILSAEKSFRDLSGLEGEPLPLPVRNVVRKE